MKYFQYFLFSTLLLAFLSDMPQAQTPHKFRNQKKFTQEYDKFRDVTYWHVGSFSLSEGMSSALNGENVWMSAAFAYPGTALSTPVEKIGLIFTTSTKEWLFLNSRELFMIVDGERMSFGEGNRSSSIGHGGVFETLAFLIDSESFKKIGSAKKVEILVGPRQYKLKDEHLEAFRDLLSLTTPVARQ